tara:strand:- start:147 stop:1007 length:861 start_codon:yes stop_codon:yes gene_type:complete
MPTIYAATDAFSAQSGKKDFTQSDKYERNSDPSTSTEAKIPISYTLANETLVCTHERSGFDTPAYMGALDRRLYIRTVSTVAAEGSYSETYTLNRYTGATVITSSGTSFFYSGYTEQSDVTVEDSATRYERVVTSYREDDDAYLVITIIMTDPMTIEDSWGYALSLLGDVEGDWDGTSGESYEYDDDGEPVSTGGASGLAGVSGAETAGIYYSKAVKTSHKFTCAFPVRFYYRIKTRTYDRDGTLSTTVDGSRIQPIAEGEIFYVSPLGAYYHDRFVFESGRAYTN